MLTPPLPPPFHTFPVVKCLRTPARRPHFYWEFFVFVHNFLIKHLVGASTPALALLLAATFVAGSGFAFAALDLEK